MDSTLGRIDPVSRVAADRNWIVRSLVRSAFRQGLRVPEGRDRVMIRLGEAEGPGFRFIAVDDAGPLQWLAIADVPACSSWMTQITSESYRRGMLPLAAIPSRAADLLLSRFSGRPEAPVLLPVKISRCRQVDPPSFRLRLRRTADWATGDRHRRELLRVRREEGEGEALLLFLPLGRDLGGLVRYRYRTSDGTLRRTRVAIEEGRRVVIVRDLWPVWGGDLPPSAEQPRLDDRRWIRGVWTMAVEGVSPLRVEPADLARAIRALEEEHPGATVLVAGAWAAGSFHRMVWDRRRGRTTLQLLEGKPEEGPVRITRRGSWSGAPA